jgi:hypothetical protein
MMVIKNRLFPKIKKAFFAWVTCGTWYTRHPADDGCFYRFVWTVVRFSRRLPSEKKSRDLVISKWTEKLDGDFLQSQALHCSSLYATLLDFAKVRTKGQPFLTSEVD